MSKLIRKAIVEYNSSVMEIIKSNVKERNRVIECLGELSLVKWYLTWDLKDKWRLARQKSACAFQAEQIASAVVLEQMKLSWSEEQKEEENSTRRDWRGKLGLYIVGSQKP